MWGSPASCLSSLSFVGRVLQECLSTARTPVLMAGSNIPAPSVSNPEMLCTAVCSPYWLKLHSWSLSAWQRSHGLNTPGSLIARQCFAICPQPSFSCPRQPLMSGALPMMLSLAVTSALWPKHSILPILTGLGNTEHCLSAGTRKVWPYWCPAYLLLPSPDLNLCCQAR